ncbi:MAG: hypothetical protein JXA57_08950 [Armatimonadetes bacterium]|nr:hypothetical protein [Armatimonadota bacterium]
MAGEADTQLNIQPKQGMQFYTFTLRDQVGRELPGQMEASSEAHLRTFLSDCGYELLEARQGWYAMRFKQTPADRAATVSRSVEEMLSRLVASGTQPPGSPWRVSLSSADDQITVSRKEDGKWQAWESWPPDVYPALREHLAQMADLQLIHYGQRYEGRATVSAGDTAIDCGVTIEANTIELEVLGD